MPRARQPNPADNRTDLLTPEAPGRKMVQAGQEQGKRTAQEQSQSILPVGTPPVPPAAGAPTGPSPSPGQTPAPAQGPLPGELAWMKHPGSGGPPTTGLPGTPGPGPEALSGLGAQWYANKVSEQGTLQTLLGHLASQPGASSVIKTLASGAGVSQ